MDISDLDNPTYYILTQCEIKCLMKNKIENYIDNYCKNNNVSKEDVEKREKEKKKNPEVWSVKLADIKDYNNRWDSILDLLK